MAIELLPCKMWHFHISYLCLDRVWCIWDHITADTTCPAEFHVHKCLCLTYPLISYSRGYLLFCCVYVLFLDSWAAWPWRLSSGAYLSLLNRDCFPICCLIISPLQMSCIQPWVTYSTLHKAFTLIVGGKTSKVFIPPAQKLVNTHKYSPHLGTGGGKTNSLSRIIELLCLCNMVI